MGIPGSANPMLFGGAAAYQINQSLRFDGSGPSRLTYDNTSGTNNSSSAWTLSFWMKRGSDISSSPYGNDLHLMMWTPSGTCANTEYFLIADPNHGTTAIQNCMSFNGGGYYGNIANKLRDPSAWYHFVWRGNTGSSSNIIYVNGVAVTAYNQGPTSMTSALVNGATRWSIGDSYTGCSSSPWDGYLAEVNFIDGQALTPSSFGETDTITGAWIPKKYSGSYGTNGYYLKFDPSATNGIGHDHSGNGKHWTATGFSTSGTGTDVMSDTPTNNYATLNAISPLASGTLSNGNLNFSTGNADAIAVGTVAVSSGKWYWEITATTVNASVSAIGIIGQPPASLTVDLRTPSNGYCYISNGNKGNNNATAAYGATYTSGDVIGVALDLDAGTLVFYKNNSSQGTAYSSLSGAFSPAISDLSGASGGAVFDCNFGQRAFAYTPPTGYKALNTANLPEPTIKKGDKYFDTKLYTGTGGSQSLSGLGFQPDLVWIKARSTASSHGLYDAVRGVGQVLLSNSTSAEQNYGSYGVTSFNSAGFSVNDLPGYGVNDSGQTYAAWCWDANGAGSSNTAGSITSTVSANATAGFSIVTYTGTGAQGTLGHGLGVAPSFVIVRNRDQTANWLTYHSAYGLSHTTYPNWQYLNLTVSEQNSGSSVNHPFYQRPSSTVLYLNTGTSELTNVSGQKHIAYCFSEVAGYSKFGSYTGNGSSSDGPFVACNFRPAWIMLKVSSTDNSWFIYDVKRNTYNAANQTFKANGSDAENTGSSIPIDILSNGFKLRSLDGGINGSGSTYIFAAFAEHPFKYANAR